MKKAEEIIDNDELDLTTPSEEELAAVEEEISNEKNSETDVPTTQAPALTAEQMRNTLELPIPPRLLKKMSGKGGSGTLTYVHWLTIYKFLKFRAPLFQYRVTHVETTDLGVAVVAEISIPCADGVIVGSGVGFKEHKTGAQGKPTGFGGAPVVAERQAFKRAAAMLGLGVGLYDGK